MSSDSVPSPGLVPGSPRQIPETDQNHKTPLHETITKCIFSWTAAVCPRPTETRVTKPGRPWDYDRRQRSKTKTKLQHSAVLSVDLTKLMSSALLTDHRGLSCYWTSLLLCPFAVPSLACRLCYRPCVNSHPPTATPNCGHWALPRSRRMLVPDTPRLAGCRWQLGCSTY